MVSTTSAWCSASRAAQLIATSGASPQVRRLPLGNLIFKGLGAAIAIPLLPQAHVWLQLTGAAVHEQVVWFHLGFNIMLALIFISFTGVVGRLVEKVLPEPRLGADAGRPRRAAARAARARRGGRRRR